MQTEKCQKCLGSKRINGMGGMTTICPQCKGVGHTELLTNSHTVGTTTLELNEPATIKSELFKGAIIIDHPTINAIETINPNGSITHTMTVTNPEPITLGQTVVIKKKPGRKPGYRPKSISPESLL